MGASLAHHAHVFPASMNAEGTIDRLLRLLDACGIERAVCFAPFAQQWKDPSQTHNEWLAKELTAHGGRVLGFGTIDFQGADLAGQVRRAKELGLLGLKLHPNTQRFAVLSEKAFEVYGAAEEMGMFCTFHTGVHASRLRDCRVIDFDEVAQAFPRLRFSMEHVGGYHFFPEALAVIFNHVPPPWKTGECNVYAGLASVFTTHVNRFWHLSRERLLELVAQVGVRQLIFGLDFPYNREDETKIGLETVRSLGLGAEGEALVLGGNLARVLGLKSEG